MAEQILGIHNTTAKEPEDAKTTSFSYERLTQQVKPKQEYCIQFKKNHPNAVVPKQAYMHDTGYDLYAVEDIRLFPQKVEMVDVGLSIGFPPGWWAEIRERSGLASKGVKVSGGIIDNGYTGPIKVLLTYFTPNLASVYDIKAGDKIAQLILHVTHIPTIPMAEVDEIKVTARGSNGFGSSDKTPIQEQSNGEKTEQSNS